MVGVVPSLRAGRVRSDPAYIRNAPSARVNGFVVIELLAGANFNVYPVIVSGDSGVLGGARLRLMRS